MSTQIEFENCFEYVITLQFVKGQKLRTQNEQTYLICSIVKEKGFEFEREVTDHQAVYCQNPKSMLQYHYKCVFSTATKSSGGAPVM